MEVRFAELMKRVHKIIKSDDFKIEDDCKINWMDSPIAYATPGKNYLNPKLELIVDEAIDQESKEKLYKTTREKGVRFYDKKGSGYMKDGKKKYD